MDDDARQGRLPLLVTGVGLGAFADGILFHQVLQWHHLVAAYEPTDTLGGLEVNTFWDGVFHVACWLVMAVAVVMLVRRADAVRRLGGRAATGLVLLGVGAFHVLDTVVFHVLLQAHHIRMVDDYLVYDVAYFVSGLVLLAVGAALARRPRLVSGR